MKKLLIILIALLTIGGGLWFLDEQEQGRKDRDGHRQAGLMEWRATFTQFKQTHGRYPSVDGELGGGAVTGGFQEAGGKGAAPPLGQDRFVYATNPDGSVFVLCTKLEQRAGKQAFYLTSEDEFNAATKGCHTGMTAEFAQYVKTSGMSDTAASLLYAHDPQIVTKSFIQGRCSDSIHGGSQVQGCYDGEKIYVIDLQRPEILDEMQVSAAHEMLHAAFDDLTEKERQVITKEIQTVAAAITEPGLKEHLAQYDGDQHTNELHSILGTEYANLSPKLEEHYQRYFDDRSKVLAIHAKYQQIIDELKAEIDRLQAELDAMGKRADALLAAERIREYNVQVGPYNTTVDRLNQTIDHYNALTEHTRPEAREEPAGKR